MMENYRPDALANTMHKPRTGLMQECLNVHADHRKILRNSQEGFRRYRNTTHQLHTLTDMLSEAKLSEQNLFTRHIDLHSAFSTIDTDRLLQITYDLGFPPAATNMSEDLDNNIG